VWEADDDDLGDVVVGCIDSLFDLDRGQVLAAGLDDVFASVASGLSRYPVRACGPR
jgi:hypothetical protein